MKSNIKTEIHNKAKYPLSVACERKQPNAFLIIYTAICAAVIALAVFGLLRTTIPTSASWTAISTTILACFMGWLPMMVKLN